MKLNKSQIGLYLSLLQVRYDGLYREALLDATWRTLTEEKAARIDRERSEIRQKMARLRGMMETEVSR